MRMYLSLDEANTIACLIELHKARGQLNARQEAIYKRIKALMHRHFQISRLRSDYVVHGTVTGQLAALNAEQTKDQTEDERGDFR